ncbi:MAG: DNA repair protein RecO [Dehalococcoidia bacterium]|jgi:DNA repair protein RecO (recombination protein O)
MTAPKTYQTEAIIIKRIKLGEADRILTLYTPELGKLKAVAKGTRRPKSKLGGHVELLTHSRLMLARGRNLDIITQAQTIDNFLPIKDDLEGISRGLYIAELVDSFTGEHIEDRQLFDLLLETLKQLSQSKDYEPILRYFELHLLDHLGYRPQLQHCTGCNSQLKPDSNFFSSSLGGVLCYKCGLNEPVARPLSLNALKVLRLWQNCDFAAARRVRINRELAIELEQVMREYIRYLLEKQLKSTAWLDRLKSEITHK